MYDWKPYFLYHGRRFISAVKDKSTLYWMMTACGCCALLLLLATGNVMLPVAVIAAPTTPTDGATFNITWSTSCQTPPAEAVTALDYAAALWGTWLSSTVPIKVTVCWTPNLSGGDVLGTGMPTQYIRNFSGAPLMGTAYPIALANALNGSDLYPALGDMTLQFKSDTTWSFVLTSTHLTAPVAGEDFVTVALHELAHGLGFIGNMYESYNVGFCGNGPYGYLYPCPTPYDWFAVDSSNVALLSYLLNDPYALAARLKSDANFSGPNTRAANGGTAAKLYTPSIFYWGSSLSHLDQTTFGASPNRLMTPSYSGITRHPGAVTLAMFQDMGWLRADGVPNVVTSGPWIVGAGTATPFTGTLLWSGYTGQPITYTWTTVGQDPLVRPGLADSDTVTLTWDTPGEKVITLTATDGDLPASAIRTLLAFAANVTGPSEGKTDRAYTFNADVTLDGYPVAYTWEATGQAPAMSDSVTFTWPVSGTKTITVTANIEGALTQAVHTIDIEETIYRYIYLPLVQRQS